MKRLITIFLVLALILPAAATAVDLEDMSFDELVVLREQINLAIWNSQEWQSVTVPQGVWEVGKDIPVGKWTISLAPEASSDWGELFYCSGLDETGTRANWNSKAFTYIQLGSQSREADVDQKSVDIDCKKDMYIIIERAPMVFTPYVGKPDLGFK
jgi:hypothetical protein